MKKNDVEQLRSLWLAVGKEIVEKCFERESQLLDLCPQRTSLSHETKNQALRKISRLSKDIGTQVQKIADIEKKGGLGFSIVLGKDTDELEIVVMSLLTAARFDSSVARSIRIVQDVMDYVAVRNPSTALRVRNMFRADGKMFPFVTLGRYITLDEMSVTLRESTLNKIVGMPSDTIEARCEAEALLGNSKKGLII